MTDIKVFINSEYKSQMYMGYDEGENRIVIAFRGSDNIRNWLSDLNFSTSTYPLCNKCAIHTGFYNVWKGLEEQTFHYYKVLRLKYPEAKLVVTGHSLGAAVATIAALELAN